VEPAFDAVNNADSVEEMQAALENEDLGLNLDAYNALSTDEKAEVAARVLENRPEDDEGYPLPDDIQAALDQAVDEVGEEDPEEPGDGDESGGVWFSGEGEPEADLGDEGDFYLDESTGDYYKKTSEGWELRGNFKGEDGEDGEDGEAGTIWFVDEGEPEADLGDEGDFYLDESTGDYYKKTSEGWELRGNFKGDDGEDGEDGEAGTVWFVDEGEPEADLGDEGDFYLDELTGDYYKKTSEGWELRGNFKGEDGEDGATWLVGEGKPAAEKGNEGDLYLDVDSGDVYLKSAEGWSIIA